MFYLVIFLGLTVGCALGVLLARVLKGLFWEIKRASDKQRIKLEMREDAYQNQLFEECICEEMDDLARRAAREMDKVRRR